MAERPIIFTADSVRAILAGRKVQSRWVMKPQPPEGYAIAEYVRDPHLSARFENAEPPLGMWTKRCPYGAAGSRLWVREAWAVDAPLADVRAARADVYASPAPGLDGGPYYRADRVHENTGLRWRSPIHMPRWASRLTLEILSVRVERVQAISEADARAEGVDVAAIDHAFNGAPGCFERSARGAFAAAWDAVNGRRAGCSWADNPWCWVLEFRRVEA